jgi:hypothetical protein
MSQLFIELYLDEDVNALVATLVRAQGFMATTARAEGQLRKSDDEQLAYAVGQRKTLLTHNRRHFEALAVAYHELDRSHFGIIIARRRSPYELARRLLLILNRVAADEIQDQVHYI